MRHLGPHRQAWLPSLGLWHYKARAYQSELGRFPNLHAYVLNDSVNLADPLGLSGELFVAGFIRSVPGKCVDADGLQEQANRERYAGNRPEPGGVGAKGGRQRQKPKNEGRRCTSFQRFAERVADSADQTSNMAGDISIASAGAAGVAAAVGAEPAAATLGLLSAHFYKQSAGWGIVAEIADFASGNYGKTIGQRIQGAFIDQFGRRLNLPERSRDAVKDSANVASKANRCTR